MVRVTARRSGTAPGSDLFLGLIVTGHANSAKSGEFDLVCAAVSAIAQSAVIGLEEHLHLNPEVHITEGYLSCVLSDEWDASTLQRASDILAAAWYGLQAIGSQYPRYVALSETYV